MLFNNFFRKNLQNAFHISNHVFSPQKFYEYYSSRDKQSYICKSKTVV